MNGKDSIKIMKALADESRLSIMRSLLIKPQYVEELSQRFNLAASTVSFHLKKLEAARLIHKEKEQYYVVYHPNESVFELALNEIVKFENKEEQTQEERIKKYKDKVLKTYFMKNKLIKIPSQHKKRWIVLEKFAEKFEGGKVYQESEINDLIAADFEDYCTIRRYLIDEGLMTRKSGKYWKVENETNQQKNKVQNLKKSFLDSVENV